ncbi:unnamed protein product [Closterium sp. NIES-54]
MKWMDEPRRQSDWQQPIHLVELFGGIGAGLSAVVRSGIAVRKWTYVEKELMVRKMAEHHAWKLQAEFPELLSRRVIQEPMGGTIHDVLEIGETEVASGGQVDLLVAGWECQGGRKDELCPPWWRMRGRLDTNATAAPRASEADRRRALGNAMDGHVLRWLIQRMWQETVVSWGHEEEKGGVEAVPHGAWSCQKKEEEKWEVGEAMSEEGKEAMQQLLARHRKCFALTMQKLGRCKVKEMELKLRSTEPVFHRRRKMPHRDEEICEKIKELLEVGLIRRSESEYATPTVVAAKRDLRGEVLSRRMCGDYRALNKITIADRYPMPMAEEIFDKLAEGVFFTTLDLREGFNQIKIREEDIKKTAFHGPDGLVMDSVLREVECAACYIDDVVIFSTTEQQHLQDVERTLAAIETEGLTYHLKKCRWGEQTVQYLGYEVKGGQIRIQQAKLEVLDRLREPKDKSGLRAVLGFLSYYRRFVPNFSKRVAVLNGLLREDKAWEWGEAQKGALQDLMTAVKTAMVLKLPTADHPFTLYTDWSSQGMGGILCQEVEGEEKVVAYASRICNSAEAQYSSYIGEGLAEVWAVGHFRVYLQGREFTLVTDHQPLTWLMTTPGLTGRNAWWAMKLQEYDFKIKHRPAHGRSLSEPPTARAYSNLHTAGKTGGAEWGQGTEGASRYLGGWTSHAVGEGRDRRGRGADGAGKSKETPLHVVPAAAAAALPPYPNCRAALLAAVPSLAACAPPFAARVPPLAASAPCLQTAHCPCSPGAAPAAHTPPLAARTPPLQPASRPYSPLAASAARAPPSGSPLAAPCSPCAALWQPARRPFAARSSLFCSPLAAPCSPRAILCTHLPALLCAALQAALAVCRPALPYALP